MNNIPTLNEKEIKIANVVEKFLALDEKNQMYILGYMQAKHEGKADLEKILQQYAS